MLIVVVTLSKKKELKKGRALRSRELMLTFSLFDLCPRSLSGTQANILSCFFFSASNSFFRSFLGFSFGSYFSPFISNLALSTLTTF